jgi:hypothetical protein
MGAPRRGRNLLPDDTWIGSGGGELRVHTGAGRDTPLEVYMGRDRPVWAELAQLGQEEM